jgi:ADP-dependent phosphofructokinase/glucokinase
METNKPLKPPRDLAEVIIVIKDLIPLVEIDLIKAINKLIDNLKFQALEVRTGGYYWCVLTNILNKHIPNIIEDWQIKIQDIVSYNY